MSKVCACCKHERDSKSFRQWVWWDLLGKRQLGPRMPVCAVCWDRLHVETTSERRTEVQLQLRKQERILERKVRAAEKERIARVKHDAVQYAKNKVRRAEEKKELASDDVIERELLERELARRSLIEFIKRFNPTYEAGWVHEDICRRLKKFLNAMDAGESPRLMLFMPPRHGKLCAHDTVVPTPTGTTTHGALKVGDEVFGADGAPTQVVALGEDGHADCLVTLSDGSGVKCHEAHEWEVYDRAYGQWRVMETREIMRRKLTSGSTGRRGGRYILQIRNEPAIVRPHVELPVDPYFLGFWLGRTPNKHIPDMYINASIEQRLDVLAGLIDSDGHVERATSRVRIATCDEALAKSTYRLAQTLGFRPYITEQPPCLSTSGIQGRRRAYYVGFQPTMDIPTQIPRKRIGRIHVHRRRAITAVRKIAAEEGRCIQVAAEDGLYLIGNSLIPTHNSMIASHHFPAWALGQYPQYEIIAASYGSSLPNKFSRQVRAFLRDKRYHSLFPETRLDPTNEGVEGWSTTRGGGYIPAGVGGGITGKGAHIFIVDDPIKDAEEADSETIRQNIWDWWGSTAYTRLAPNAGVLVIQTRWHDDDLAGRMIMQMREELREAGEVLEMHKANGMPIEEAEEKHAQMLREIDRWEIIEYPAISTEAEWLNRDGTVTAEPTSVGAKFLRNKNEALHPERFDYTRLMKIKRTLQPRHWSALYQQNPVPDEGMFFTKTMLRYDRLPDFSKFPICMAWDLAVGQKQQNDYTVGVIGCLDYYDRIVVLEVIRAKMDTHQAAETILGAYDKYNRMVVGNPVIGIENGQLRLAMKPHLDKVMDEQRLFPSFDDTLTPISDKIMRARPLQGRMQQGKVYFTTGEPWIQAVEHELLRFPGGVHDDIVDALAWLTRMFANVSAPKRDVATGKTESWRKKLIIPGSRHPMSA